MFDCSRLDVLLKFLSRLTWGEDVQHDSVGVENRESTISPRMIFQRHDRGEAGTREASVLCIHVIDLKVVHQPGRVAGLGAKLTRCHELQLG